jgi:GMP synthase (glutamine-hydrolysing)
MIVRASGTLKTALVLRHVGFEDLGTFETPIEDALYRIEYRDIGDEEFPGSDLQGADLLVVLGGPMGVYQDEAYPFLRAERDAIAGRVRKGKNTLGICLGAQLIASALGARVYPAISKEIGFSAIKLTEEGKKGPLRHLLGATVLHWHGDTYMLPDNAVHLASTVLVEQQAFAIGNTILGLQFHVEADLGPNFERWLVGHAAELATADIDIVELRNQAKTYGKDLRARSVMMITDWLAGL